MTTLTGMPDCTLVNVNIIHHKLHLDLLTLVYNISVCEDLFFFGPGNDN